MRSHTIFATLVLLSTAVFAVPANAFHADNLPVLQTYSTDGSGAFGVKLDTADGNFAIDLIGYGPSSASTVSVAVFMLNAQNNVVFGFAFTGHGSPDRLVLSASETAGDAALVPDWMAIEPSSSATDARCPYACLGLRGTNGVPGTYRYVMWVGDVPQTGLEIRGTPGTVATVTKGTAYVMGDAEIASGSPNVQVQHTAPAAVPGVTGRVGLKIMQDATVDVAAKNAMYGFFGSVDFKLACQFTLGACVWKSSVMYQCRVATGMSCDTTQVSYDGPNGGASGRSIYSFLGTPAGDYTFRVDQKVDTYGPSVYERNTGTFAFLGEDYSYLTAADVLPPA